jgi:hypothetical protein
MGRILLFKFLAMILERSYSIVGRILRFYRMLSAMLYQNTNHFVQQAMFGIMMREYERSYKGEKEKKRINVQFLVRALSIIILISFGWFLPSSCMSRYNNVIIIDSLFVF